jgi:hypothetical protein
MLGEQRGKVLTAIAGIAAVAGALEILLLPFFYGGIPLPLPNSAKPIGGALFVVTFFHLLIISGSLFAFALVLKRFGIESKLLPKTRNDWIDVLMFFVLLVFGLLTWYNPLALIGVGVAGIYLAFVELK